MKLEEILENIRWYNYKSLPSKLYILFLANYTYLPRIIQASEIQFHSIPQLRLFQIVNKKEVRG